MNIIDFFNPYNIDHLVAYVYLEDNGHWPDNFLPENVTFSFAWQVSLVSKIAEAYLQLAIDGKIENMPLLSIAE